MSPDAALMACRFVHAAAAMLLFGAYAYLWALVPPGLAAEVVRRLRAGKALAVAAALASALAALPLEAATIGEGWRDALDPGTLGAVLFDTGVGQALQVQAAATLLTAATLFLSGPMASGATAGAAGLLLAGLALTGHAAMHEAGLGALHRLNDAVHVLAGGAWLGALVPLLPILRALDDPRRRREASLALRRFSGAGHGAVALVLLTGALNTALVLGRLPVASASPYQALLAVKIALALVMTGLAVLNRYGVVPRMGGRDPRALRVVRATTLVEIVLGLAVVGLVSVFGLLEPARL